MELYLVTRQGIYMQGIVGVFSTIEKAENAVKHAKAREFDGYHEFNIDLFHLDKEKDLSVYKGFC